MLLGARGGWEGREGSPPGSGAAERYSTLQSMVGLSPVLKAWCSTWLIFDNAIIVQYAAVF